MQLYGLLQRKIDSKSFSKFLAGSRKKSDETKRVAGGGGGGDGKVDEEETLLGLDDDDAIFLDEDEINEAVVLSQQCLWMPSVLEDHENHDHEKKEEKQQQQEENGAPCTVAMTVVDRQGGREGEKEVNLSVAAAGVQGRTGGEARMYALDETSNGDNGSSSSSNSIDVAGGSIPDDYVMVHKGDVVDAMAHFIAAYVMLQPRARTISPEQLHSQLKVTFRELQRGYIRRIWDGGKTVFRYASLTYGAARYVYIYIDIPRNVYTVYMRR